MIVWGAKYFKKHFQINAIYPNIVVRVNILYNYLACYYLHLFKGGGGGGKPSCKSFITLLTDGHCGFCCDFVMTST